MGRIVASLLAPFAGGTALAGLGLALGAVEAVDHVAHHVLRASDRRGLFGIEAGILFVRVLLVDAAALPVVDDAGDLSVLDLADKAAVTGDSIFDLVAPLRICFLSCFISIVVAVAMVLECDD